MKKYLISLPIFIVAIFSCKTKDSFCQAKGFKEIRLAPSKLNMSIPAECHLFDTTIFDDIYREYLLSYIFKSPDSSLSLAATIQNDKMHKGHFSYQNFYWANKNEVDNLPDRKSTLVTDSSKNIDTVKVGYLKYLVIQKGNEYYEGRIFFIRENTITRLWLIEKFNKDKDKNHLLMDCVFDSMKLY